MKTPDSSTKKPTSPLGEVTGPVQMTMRSQPHYTMHIVGQPERDPDAAVRAVERIKQIGSKYAPSKSQGATPSVRKLRDRGE
jgi:hypothetical protein